MQNALRADVFVLKTMHLDPPYESIISSLTKTYEVKIKISERLIAGYTEMLSGEKPNVDYSPLIAELAKAEGGGMRH